MAIPNASTEHAQYADAKVDTSPHRLDYLCIDKRKIFKIRMLYITATMSRVLLLALLTSEITPFLRSVHGEQLGIQEAAPSVAEGHSQESALSSSWQCESYTSTESIRVGSAAGRIIEVHVRHNIKVSICNLIYVLHIVVTK